jgi:hypothetical protein
LKTRFSVILLMIMLATGSVWAEDKTVGSPPYSGFLKNEYTKLQGSADHEGLWTYIDQSRDFKGYKKLIFDPILINNPPYLKGSSVEPKVLYQMRGQMLSSLTEAFTSGYEIVQEPGPDVLKVRISIFGVEMVKPGWKLGDNTPIKKGLDFITGGKVVPVMTVEMQVLDAENKTVAAAVAMRKGEKEMFKDDKLTWDDLQPIVNYWASGLRLGLDQQRQVNVSSGSTH